jgi:D-proline reductase (dithiol) PrdB
LAKIPFIYPKKALHESRLSLVTTGGVHLPEDVRFDIDDPSGDCSYREIPNGADILTWTHVYYAPDRDGTDLDSVFPLWTLKELEAEGVVGELNRRHFSFMGAIHDPAPLVGRTAPEVARKLVDDRVDVVLLTPS